MLAVETGNQLVVRELLINKAKEQLKIVKPVSRLTLIVNLVSSLKTCFEGCCFKWYCYF